MTEQEMLEIWSQVLKLIKKEISFSNYNVFFRNSFIVSVRKERNETWVELGVANSFIQQNIESKHLDLLSICFEQVLGEKVKILFLIREKISVDTASETPLFNQETERVVERKIRDNNVRTLLEKCGLMKEYTFENFAVSPSNEVAYAAAIAVSKNIARAYNPLFLYGDVGVGKTHLMHSVGIRVLEKRENLKLINCIGEEFTNEIIDAIRLKQTAKFRERYRKAEMLLIDDIQFIAGKNTVQEEFFHTFNAIKNTGGQIILTSDRPPSEIKLLEDRLRSRFEEGLIIDIQEPNFELRTAILLIKSKQMGIHLPMDVAQTIANNITSTRLLQGFLSKLHAVASLKNKKISNELALELLEKDNIKNPIAEQKKYVNPKEVIEAVSKHFNISSSALFGPRRSRPIVIPRQYAMYLLKSDLDMPYMEIGRMFGGRDHTTVMHSVEKITKLVSISKEMQMEFSTIRKKVYG